MADSIGGDDVRLKKVLGALKCYSDFPKAGVEFLDIFSIAADPGAFRSLMDIVVEKAKMLQGQIDCVVALDSRGFLFGPAMALELDVPLVPVSQPVVPGEIIQDPKSSNLDLFPQKNNKQGPEGRQTPGGRGPDLLRPRVRNR